jgi:arthrofactin-type cyclic lipopeptide synthetase A
MEGPLCTERSALSLSQREIYFEHKLAPSSNRHTIGGFIQISGPLDAAVFLRALQDTLEENDTFGVRLCETRSEADVAYLRPSVEVPVLDFSANPEVLSDWMRKRFRERIDILGAPLFEFALLRESPTSHYWFIKAHHVIIDGWGISLLGQSVAAKYSAFHAGRAPATVAPPPYADFVENDLRYLVTPAHAADRSYWRGVLAQAPPSLFAPYAGSGDGEIGERIADVLDAQTFGRLTDFGVRHGASAFTVLVACLYTFFSRAYLRSDITFGYPILNRASSKERAKIGLFTRLLPLRVSAAPSATFREIVVLVAKAQRSNLRHRRCPLSEMFPGSSHG